MNSMRWKSANFYWFKFKEKIKTTDCSFELLIKVLNYWWFQLINNFIHHQQIAELFFNFKNSISVLNHKSPTPWEFILNAERNWKLSDLSWKWHSSRRYWNWGAGIDSSRFRKFWKGALSSAKYLNSEWNTPYLNNLPSSLL